MDAVLQSVESTLRTPDHTRTEESLKEIPAALPYLCYTEGEHTVTGRETVVSSGTAIIHLKDNAICLATENSTIHTSGHSKCEAHDTVTLTVSENSEAWLYDRCKATVYHTADVHAFDHARVTGWGGQIRLYDYSHASVSKSLVWADDDSTISIIAHSVIDAKGRVKISQGPFVDTSDVTCDEDAVLTGAWRPSENVKKGYGLFPDIKHGGI